MKKGGKDSRQKKTSPKSEALSPDMRSVLFNPQLKEINSTSSVVVPDTPPIYPNISSSIASSVLSVMETPDMMDSNSPREDDGDVNIREQVERARPAQRVGSVREELDAFIDTTPDLNLGKRRSLVSILESEHSFSNTLQSQKMKNSSMVSGQNKVKKSRKESTKEIGSFSPHKGRKKRMSLADVILPFDLNNTRMVSNKLGNIRAKEQERRQSMNSPRRSTPAKSRNSPRRSTPAKSRKSSLTHALREDVVESKNDKNATIIFDSEDLALTPVSSSSQKTLEKTLHGIIGGLESDKLDETEPLGRLQPLMVDKQKYELPILSLQSLCPSLDTRLSGPVKNQEQTRDSLARNNAARNVPDEQNKTRPKGTSLHSAKCTDETTKDGCDGTPGQPPSPKPELESILQGLVVYVEVRMGSDNRSSVIKDQLRSLGADVRERLTVDVSHVVFRDGSKYVFDQAMKRGLHVVSSLWVEACREKLQRAPEALFPSCSMESYTKPLLTAKWRKVKSMQPKEFSEEEALAANRARRRHRRLQTLDSPATSSSTASDVQCFTPQCNAAKKEAVDSPLFGISHLLTPQRRSSGSSSSSEEEEENITGIDLPTKISTPLVKRLYNRFISPRSGSNRRTINSDKERQENPSLNSSWEDLSHRNKNEKSEREKTSSVALDNLECQMTFGSKTLSEECVRLKLRLSDTSATNSESSNVEAMEMPVRLSSSLSRGESTSSVDHAQGDTQHVLELRPKRSCRVNGKLTRLSVTNKTLSSECGTSKVRENTSSFTSDSSLEDFEHVDKPNLSCKRVISLLSSSEGFYSDRIDNSLLNKVPRKRRWLPSSGESILGDVNTTSSTSCLAIPQQSTCETGLEDPQYKGRFTRSRTKSNNKIKVSPEKIPVEGDGKLAIDSKYRKTSHQTPPKRQSTSSVSSHKNTRKKSNGELNDDLHKEKERLSPESKTHMLDSQFLLSQGSQSTSCLSSSQVRRRKLLCMDTIVASQELIVPVTPEAHTRKEGIYTKLKIKGSTTQRAAMKKQKDHSTMPLPRNSKTSIHGKNKSAESTFLTEETNPSKSLGNISKILKRSKTSSSSQNPSCKWPESEDDSVFSSEEERVSIASKILPIPRDRDSIEEFQNVMDLRPRPEKPKTMMGASICLTSIHSKEIGSLVPIIKKLGGFQVINTVNSSTTHVVCGETRRTMNLLLGIARGCWILDVCWLYQSLEMASWAPEEPFELFIFCPGAKICREQRENQRTSYQQTLFSGVGSIFVKEGCIPPSKQLKKLLHLCGADLVTDIREANLVIGSPTAASGARRDFAQITHVSEKWALDSIQQHKIQCINDYSVS
ncbi:microcephalin-like isoform X2 [Homarus americanus]|uniref:microcephalin-like isoform X2 n=1 Tax=Homarus americanus TaxID=6706 RepID=UPI001C481A7D|nr:microcephalin-like isoform X2 [Homarus americanus]